MLFTLLACNPDVDLAEQPESGEPVDVTVSDADLGELSENQIVLTGADIVLEPGTDTMICYYGTYTGPDVGLHDVHTYQGRYGHHFTFNGTTTPAIDVPDGTVVDCTEESDEFQMSSLEPIGLPNVNTVNGETTVAMPLPEGMAVELESGQRYILQSHYLNSSPDPIRVTDKVVLTTIPTEEVETWAAPLIFNRGDFVIPPGESYSTSFSCTTGEDVNLLYSLGHMHEWGTSFRVDQVEGEDRIPFYSVPEWDPVFRDAPMIVAAVEEPIVIPAGTTFETTCEWFNDTDHELVFPHEMCVNVNFVYPQKTTIICDGDGQ
jgi:hypothetical protein